MALLFTDSTYDMQVGLLDEDFRWLELRSQSGKKASAVLQNETYEICLAHGVKPQELSGIITVAGPGFYTGLRLSEGFSDIFKVFNVPSYSFYSYEIPRLLGHRQGVWTTKAYRGEYFFHEWQDETSTNSLIATKDLDAHLEEYEHFFIHSPNSMDRSLDNHTSTLDLLKHKPEVVLREVVRAKLQRETFYFRAPEDEFRVSV